MPSAVEQPGKNDRSTTQAQKTTKGTPSKLPQSGIQATKARQTADLDSDLLQGLKKEGDEENFSKKILFSCQQIHAWYGGGRLSHE